MSYATNLILTFRGYCVNYLLLSLYLLYTLKFEMVSYKRLTPEEVNFSGAALLDPDETTDTDLKEVNPELPLLPQSRRCSITVALLTLGGLIVVLSGIWLLGTIFWLHKPPSTEPHRPPPPAVAKNPNGTWLQPESCSQIPEAWRFDCYPERGVVVTEEMCHARNCCFIQHSQAKTSRRNGVPWCFYTPDYPSYELVSITDTEMGKVGKLLRSKKTYYPKDIDALQLDVMYEEDNRLRVKVRALLVFMLLAGYVCDLSLSSRLFSKKKFSH